MLYILIGALVGYLFAQAYNERAEQKRDEARVAAEHPEDY